jgi:hypothetical protein
MLNASEVAVKLMAVTLAPLMVSARLAGLKVKPFFDGVTVKAPLANPVKL